MWPRLVTLTVALFLIVATTCRADVGGGVLLQVQDSSAHACIDVTKYDVSMMLVALQAARTNTFWKQSKTMGAKFDVTFLNKEGKEFTFPRGALLSAKDISGDIALLPVSFPIMAKYSLMGEQPYVNVTLHFYLVNAETISQPVNAILGFIEFSKSLPIPPNPYVQGVQHFANFAQKIFSDNVRSAEEKNPVAIFSFDLPSSAEDVRDCPIAGLREGINAIMFSYAGLPEEGIIPLSDYSKYCYELESTSRRILYRPKKGDACDSQAPSAVLRNPLVAFVVSKWSKNPAATTAAAVLQEIKPAQRPQQQGLSITKGSADLVLSRLSRTDEAAADVKGVNVKTILDILNAGNLPDDARSASTLGDVNAPARVREAETAVNLHLCSLAGIAAFECQ